MTLMNELGTLDPLSRALAVLIGIALITMGRRLFWLFVAVAGFAVGWEVAGTYLAELAMPPLAVAVLTGFLGAFVAIFAQKIAVTLAGFVVGALIGSWILPWLPMATSSWHVFIVIVAALAGGISARQAFKIALALLSSAAGALLIVETANLTELPALFLFGALTAVGWVMQRSEGRRRRIQ